jgi:hypothetical protein
MTASELEIVLATTEVGEVWGGRIGPQLKDVGIQTVVLLTLQEWAKTAHFLAKKCKLTDLTINASQTYE